MVSKLKELDQIILSPNLDTLVDVDINLNGLWQSFEKDAMTTIERVSEGAATGIRLPTIFGYPETIYYHNGIIAFRSFKGHVFIFFIIDLEKRSRNSAFINRKVIWN